MKHKKPKASNKKKQKGKKDGPPVEKQTKDPSVDELIEAGDAAAAATETDKALAFFVSAESLLRKDQSTSTTDSKQKLVYVLEKLGEAKASLGDHEAAKQDFENAIQLLTSNENLIENTAQYHETLAGLHLYIGQLSSDLEALEAYKKGLQSLELGVELRQKECTEMEQSQKVEDNSMEIETSKNGEAKALVEEARWVS